MIQGMSADMLRCRGGGKICRVIVRAVIFFILLLNFADAQFKESVEKNIRVWQRVQGCLEGYSQTLSGQTITYPRLRPDRSIALLTRATTGTMSIEWKTEKISPAFSGKEISFVVAAGMYGQDEKGYRFDLFCDDKHRFTFSTTTADSWEVKGDEGGGMAFYGVSRDQYRDVFGYLLFSLPSEWVIPGEPVRIKILGEKAGSSAWFMVFQEWDVLPFLAEKVALEAYCDFSIEPRESGYRALIKSSSGWAGKQLRFTLGRGKSGATKLLPMDGSASASFSFESGENDPFELFIENEKILDLKGFHRYISESEIHQKILVSVHGGVTPSGGYFAQYQSVYMPELGNSLISLSDVNKEGSAQHLIISTHQDIAWMDSPDQCVKERDEKIITPALSILRQDPEYCFDLEDALILREYLERHPDSKSEIAGLMREGRLRVGATFTQPYEDLCSGEMLVRQFYGGRRWIKKNFPGCDTHTAWNPDVPGRSLQMPQVMQKAGVPYFFISRFAKGLFNWLSPDSSGVIAFSPGHYALFNQCTAGKNFQEFALCLATSAHEWYTGTPSINIPVVSMTDMSTPVKYDDFLQKWNSLSSGQRSGDSVHTLSLPPLCYSTAERFFDAAIGEKLKLPVVIGERPNIWLYIHGPTHHFAISAKREADIYLTAAETFASVDALIGKSFAKYPQKELTSCWEAQIYPDHGWGGKNGEVTDSTFKAKYEYARDVSKRICFDALESIAENVNTSKGKGLPLVVFNSLSWKRSSPVEFTAKFKRGAFKQGFRLVTASGNPVTIQVISREQYQDGSLKSADILFVAADVPPVGYATFYLKPSQSKAPPLAKASQTPGVLENGFYKITLGEGGVKQIYDKETGEDILNTEKFLGGEVFTMQSVGEDAGEWAEPQHPTMEGFDKLSNYSPVWREAESGPVRLTVQMRQKIEHAEVLLRLMTYPSLKRIDFETSISGWDGTKYREFRQAFPVIPQSGKVAYEVPFGILEVGSDEMKGAPGERYNQEASAVHPRSIQNWIGVSDGNLGVTISSSVSVWDYVDPTDDQVSSLLLQPVMLASRRSCHGEGPWYLQQGDHFYRFCMTSHKQNLRKGRRFGTEANVPLMVVFNPARSEGAGLVEKASFFSVDAENVVLSTIKRCEDDESLIIRLFESEGKNTIAALMLPRVVQKAEETNIIEEEGKRVRFVKNQIILNIGHHSIHTLKVLLSAE